MTRTYLASTGAEPDKPRAPLHPHAMPAQEKRPFVQQLFTRIAARYDAFNRLASMGLDQHWRKQAVAYGEVRPGMRVLDVCAGTGDLALISAEAVGEDGAVFGLDFNAAMLRYAKEKSAVRRRRAAWLQGDALQLPFSTGSFDRVTIGFSTRNLTDLTAGLKEMLRVIRPGGWLIILETGRPANAVVRFGYYLFLTTVVRVIGFLLTGQTWPFTYLARSVKQFVTPRVFVERLDGLGSQARYIPLSGGLVSLFIATKEGNAQLAASNGR